MADIIQIRRDTAANWTSNDPTLANGEFGWETDTNKVKIGDGVTAWTALSYWTGAIAGMTNINDLADVIITAVANNELLAYDVGGNWINQTAAEAGVAAASHTHVEADITDLPGHSHVEADITDLDTYLPLSGGAANAMTGNLFLHAGSNPRIELGEGGDEVNKFYIMNESDGITKLLHVRAAGAALINIDAEAGDNTSDAIIRFCQYANTVGTWGLEVAYGNGTATAQHRLNATSSGDAELCAGGGAIKQGGTAVSLSGHTHLEADVTDLDHTDTDAIHDNVASEITAITEITAPAAADEFLLEDASDSNNKKSIKYENLLKFNAFEQNVTIEVSNDSGSAMAKGDLCYISGDSSGVPQVTLADADAESTGSKMLVVIAETINNGADGTAVVMGVVNGFSGLTAGAVQFVHTTAGDFTETAPSGSGDIVRIAGHAISTTEIFFNPSNSFVEVA
jgi:hypothetical protein